MLIFCEYANGICAIHTECSNIYGATPLRWKNKVRKSIENLRILFQCKCHLNEIQFIDCCNKYSPNTHTHARTQIHKHTHRNGNISGSLACEYIRLFIRFNCVCCVQDSWMFVKLYFNSFKLRQTPILLPRPLGRLTSWSTHSAQLECSQRWGQTAVEMSLGRG